MKKYKYVVVFGCSMSAHREGYLVSLGETYGDVVAKHFGAKCYNLASAGASLQHTSRSVLEWGSENKDKFKDTLVIIGKTNICRIEIWNNKINDWYNDCGWFQPRKDAPWIKDRLVVDWPEEERKNYFINFYNDNVQFLYATHIIIGLQSFFKINDIDHVFFDALDTSLSDFWTRRCDDKKDRLGHKLLFDSFVSQENWYTHPEYYSMADFIGKNLELRLTKDDPHPNKEAHKFWGEYLIEFIDEKINI
jgi:hypothetical protein